MLYISNFVVSENKPCSSKSIFCCLLVWVKLKSKSHDPIRSSFIIFIISEDISHDIRREHKRESIVIMMNNRLDKTHRNILEKLN